MRAFVSVTFEVWMRILCAGLGAMGCAGDKAAQSDKEMLQGTWQVVSMEVQGQKRPAENSNLTIKGDELVWITVSQRRGSPTLEFSYTLNPHTNPKQIHMTLMKTPDMSNIGILFKGIYSLDRDGLKLCYSPDNRPDKFKTALHENSALLILKRNR